MGFRVLIVPPYYIGSGGVVSTIQQVNFVNVNTLTITHNLGRLIIARVVLNSGDEIDFALHQTNSVATITFNQMLTGTVVYV